MSKCKDIYFWQNRFILLMEHFFAYGDRNTNCFCDRANFRRRRNYMASLQNSLGIWCKKREEIEEILNSHFAHITSSSNSGKDIELLNLILFVFLMKTISIYIENAYG